jgi:transcriptional regulator of acetoin/glycerol metabolism
MLNVVTDPVITASSPTAPSESIASTGGLRDVEREMILRAYVDSSRNLSKAAKALDIPRTTLRDKLRRYGAL